MSEPYPLKTVSELAVSIKDGTHGTHPRVSEGIPFLSAKNINENGRLCWDKTDEHVSEFEYRLITSGYQPQKDDLLLTVVGSIGRRALFDGDKVCFQRSVAFIRPNKSIAHPKFLFHAMGDEFFTRQLFRRCNITAQAGLYLGELAKIAIPVPSLDNQTHIADILDVIDACIEQTEALIAKHQQIKAGLMRELFTQGVSANGQLRPCASEAPNLYQNSPFGPIHNEWALMPIHRVCTYQHGRPFPSAAYGDDGIILLRPGNLHFSGLVSFDEGHTIRIPDSFRSEAQSYIVRENDILMNLTAQSLEDDFLGRVCINHNSEESLLNQRIARFTAVDIDRQFLYWLLRSHQFRDQINRTTQGTKVQHLYNRDIDRVVFSVPSRPEEMIVISQILFSLSKKLATEEETHAKLKKMKHGLMQDLLANNQS